MKFKERRGPWMGERVVKTFGEKEHPFCFPPFLTSGSFPMSWLFTSDGQSIRALASASVLLTNIQG